MCGIWIITRDVISNCRSVGICLIGTILLLFSMLFGTLTLKQMLKLQKYGATATLQ